MSIERELTLPRTANRKQNQLAFLSPTLPAASEVTKDKQYPETRHITPPSVLRVADSVCTLEEAAMKNVGTFRPYGAQMPSTAPSEH